MDITPQGDIIDPFNIVVIEIFGDQLRMAAVIIVCIVQVGRKLATVESKVCL